MKWSREMVNANIKNAVFVYVIVWLNGVKSSILILFLLYRGTLFILNNFSLSVTGWHG